MERPAHFNRPAPPHFKGFDPNGIVTSYQRNLPHWRQPGATYFVTFRLDDSIPQNVLDYLARLRAEYQLRSHEPAGRSLREEYERHARTILENSLDEGHGACVLQDEKNIQIVKGRLDHGLGTQHFIGCAVVMPNHVPLIMKPFEGFELEDILGQIKGYSAIKINRRIGSRGTLWQDESYDRIIRDEEHLYRVIQYIGRNTAKIGHPSPDSIHWVHPEWIAAGWGFEDAPFPFQASTG